MILKSIITLLLITLAFNKVLAQEVIAASGTTISNSQGEVSYTLGQIIFTTNIALEGSIAQGVHQTYDSETLNNTEPIIENFEVVVFPNPTKDYAVLKLNGVVQDNLSYVLLDINGRTIQSQKVDFNETNINLSLLPASIYLLQVRINNVQIKTFKIIKS